MRKRTIKRNSVRRDRLIRAERQWIAKGDLNAPLPRAWKRRLIWIPGDL